VNDGLDNLARNYRTEATRVATRLATALVTGGKTRLITILALQTALALER